jgi:hypothetical protein
MNYEPLTFFGDTASVSLWQYDYGARLPLPTLENITAGMPCQWHYGDVAGVDSRTITDDGGTLYVAVPDAALQQKGDVVGYIYIHDATSGRTRYVINVKIRERAEPTESQSLDEETYIGQKAVEAAASASAAAQSATDAQTAKAAAEQAEADALVNKMNGIEAHDTSAASHPSLLTAIQTAESIARGRATAYVFDTKAEMDAWLLVAENTAKLVTGDNLYIRDTGVKDYWWDGTAAQELEAESPDLTDYYTKAQVDAMMPIAIEQTDYDALVTAGTLVAGKIYYVVADGTLP